VVEIAFQEFVKARSPESLFSERKEERTFL
jgi:hypothetical protein